MLIAHWPGAKLAPCGRNYYGNLLLASERAPHDGFLELRVSEHPYDAFLELRVSERPRWFGGGVPP